MRFLIDNALSPEVAAHLRAAGHEAIHVRDRGLAEAEDEVVLDLAAAEGRVPFKPETSPNGMKACPSMTNVCCSSLKGLEFSGSVRLCMLT